MQSGGLAPFHDFAKEKVLLGTVVKLRSFVDRWKNKKQVMEIATSSGEIVAVSSAAALKGMFAIAKKGKKVWIRFDGLKKIKGRKQPMRQYTTAVE